MAEEASGLLRNLGRGARFLAALGPHLRAPIDAERARQVVRARLDRRGDDFLRLARRAIYGAPGSPYRPLLGRAGVAFADLARLVRDDGLEGALGRLAAEGVFLTVEELKGLRPVVRGGLTLSVGLEHLRNPAWRAPHPVSGRPVARYRAMLADLAVNATLALAARGAAGWRFGQEFYAINVSGVVWLLRHQGIGYAPERWFVRLDPRAAAGPARWLPAAVRRVSVAAGHPLPRPEYVSLDDPRPVLDWLRDTLRAGRTPHLATSTSVAVHLCETARRTGHAIAGAELRVSSDPATPGRMATIREAGVRAVPSYGADESGQMAYGCLDPAHADDMHFYDDVHAVVQPGTASVASGLPERALLLTSLRESTPFVLLNVSVGDEGVLERRACGCPLEEMGWRTHLHGVRSFEKMKLGGAIVLVGPLVAFLETALPGRFGGGPIDYQLVQDDDVIVDGMPRLRLVVHPRVGPLDEGAVRDALLGGVRAAGLPEDLLRIAGRWLGVERRPPYESAHGKIYHVQRLPPAPGRPGGLSAPGARG